MAQGLQLHGPDVGVGLALEDDRGGVDDGAGGDAVGIDSRDADLSGQHQVLGAVVWGEDRVGHGAVLRPDPLGPGVAGLRLDRRVGAAQLHGDGLLLGMLVVPLLGADGDGAGAVSGEAEPGDLAALGSGLGVGVGDDHAALRLLVGDEGGPVHGDQSGGGGIIDGDEAVGDRLVRGDADELLGGRFLGGFHGHGVQAAHRQRQVLAGVAAGLRLGSGRGIAGHLVQLKQAADGPDVHGEGTGPDDIGLLVRHGEILRHDQVHPADAQVDAAPVEVLAVVVEVLPVVGVGGVAEVQDLLRAGDGHGVVVDGEAHVIDQAALGQQVVVVHTLLALVEGDAHDGPGSGVVPHGDGGDPGAGGLVDGIEVGAVDAQQDIHAVEGVAGGFDVGVVGPGGAGADLGQLHGLQIQGIEGRLVGAVVGGDVNGAVLVDGGLIDPVGQGLLVERPIAGQVPHIELDDEGRAVFVADDAVQGLFDEANVDRGAGGDGGIGHGGGSDDGGAGLHAGDHAPAVDGGHGGIGAGPGDRILHAPGQDGGGKDGAVLADDLKLRLVQRHGDLGIGELLLVEVHPVGAHVQGVVGDLHQIVLAVVGEGVGGVVLLPGLGVGVGALLQQDGAVLLQDAEPGDVLVVLGGDQHPGGAGLVADCQSQVHDLRGLVIHGDGQGEPGAVMEGVPVHAAVGLYVVFRRQLKGQGQLGVVRQGVGEEAVDVGHGVGVVPGAVVGAVVSAVGGAAQDLGHRLRDALLHDAEAGGRGVPQGGVVDGEDLVSELGGNGGAVGIVVVLLHHRVAAHGRAEFISGIADQEGLQGSGHAGPQDVVHVGGPDLAAELVLQIGALVEHGGVRPGAVVAQHGDGMVRPGGAVGGDLHGVDVALHVVAVVAVVVDAVLQVEGQTDLHAAPGGDRHLIVGAALSLAEALQQQMGVVAVHVAVAVQVRLVGIYWNGLDEPGAEVQNGLGVQGVYQIVAGEIKEAGGEHFPDGLPVHGPEGGGGELHHGVGLGPVVAGAGDVLGEEVRAQLIDHVLIGEVVQAEGEAVHAVVVGIVAQLHLDLAVLDVALGGEGSSGGQAFRIDEHVALGGDGLVHPGQARALLEHGIVDVIVVGHVDGHGRGHDQALGELADVEALGLDAAFPQILGHQGGDAGDLGGRHGGAGHGGVAGGIVAVDGGDAAAGSGDLGLQAQITGYAPGGEGGHGIAVVGVVVSAAHGGHGKGVGKGAGGAAGIVVHVVQIEDPSAGARGVAPVVGVAHGDGHHGVGVHQTVQNALILGAGGHTGGGGAQGQVHGVRAQHDGVLDGHHVVGVIGTAVLAEDLHGEDLGVVGLALDLVVAAGGLGKAAAADHVLVARGDALHVGAVVALGIVAVGDVVVAVHVVVGVGDLGGAVGGVGVDLHVELRGLGLDLGGGQQIQTGHVVRVAHVLGLGVELQGMLQTGGGEGDMVHLDAGVDDGHPGARTGDALLPDLVAAGLEGGAVHIGVGAVVGVAAVRLIPGLQHHGFHLVHGADGVQLAVGHVGGDDVGGQGDVPDHVQGLSIQDLRGDPVGKGQLLGLQLGPVVHGGGVVRDASGGPAPVHGGGVPQDDGNTNRIGVGIAMLFRRGGALDDGAGPARAELFPGQGRGLRSLRLQGQSRDRQGKQESNAEQDAEQTLNGTLHSDTPFKKRFHWDLRGENP